MALEWKHAVCLEKHAFCNSDYYDAQIPAQLHANKQTRLGLRRMQTLYIGLAEPRRIHSVYTTIFYRDLHDVNHKSMYVYADIALDGYRLSDH